MIGSQKSSENLLSENCGRKQKLQLGTEEQKADFYKQNLFSHVRSNENLPNEKILALSGPNLCEKTHS